MGQPQAIECSRCSKTFPPDKILNLCECGGPLLVRYDLAAARQAWSRDDLKAAPATMWRYSPVLPAGLDEAITLQEGWTPLLHAASLGRLLNAPNLFVKDEGRNPTGSVKARHFSCAASMARNLGERKLAIYSAGNAAGALAAYAAVAGLEAYVFMPRDVPQSNFIESEAFGAKVTLVDGRVIDSQRVFADRGGREGWFDVGTLKEPYRIEGAKTVGYELAEQFNWHLPEAVICPCGGGTGFIGMWKAFAEMEELGWIGRARPKMISVQAAGCQPITRAFEQGAATSDVWNNAHTVASGLRVPKPLGDFLVLRDIRESGGTAVSVSDEEMLDAGLLISGCEGIFAAPEGGACVVAARRLLQSGFLKPTDRIVLINTGSGLKYLEAFSTRFSRQAATEQDKLGGLITPR